MDRLVAETVMGCEVMAGVMCAGNILNPETEAMQPHFVEIPRYSIEIGEAWAVVERFLPHFRIECHEGSDYVDPEDRGKWHTDIWYVGGHACVTADTAPLAICRAALKVAMAEKVDPDEGLPTLEDIHRLGVKVER
jgi:hypothetical protein